MYSFMNLLVNRVKTKNKWAACVDLFHLDDSFIWIARKLISILLFVYLSLDFEGMRWKRYYWNEAERGKCSVSTKYSTIEWLSLY